MCGTDNDVIFVAIGCSGHLVEDRTDLEDGNYNFHSLDPLVDYECRQSDRDGVASRLYRGGPWWARCYVCYRGEN